MKNIRSKRYESLKLLPSGINLSQLQCYYPFNRNVCVLINEINIYKYPDHSC